MAPADPHTECGTTQLEGVRWRSWLYVLQSREVRLEMPESPSRNCYCNLWDTNPEILENQGLPRGFCGIYDLCGDVGHTRHYPGPVPTTGAWCDICYIVEAHKGPGRPAGAWFIDSAGGDQILVEENLSAHSDKILALLERVDSARSALCIEFNPDVTLDFYMHPDGRLRVEYSNRKAERFVACVVEKPNTYPVLMALFEETDVIETMKSVGTNCEYFEDAT